MHKVQAKSILSARNGINIYRGCTHGCIYCDSRSACYQMGHAFEDVAVKANAPELLEDALRILYVQALLAGGHPLRGGELKLMNQSLLGLVEEAAGRGKTP